VWIIWRETIDPEGRVTREYAQGGRNDLVWIYASDAFDPQPIDDHTPYQIILDNNQVFDGMVAGLPVANIAVLDPDHVTGDQTITVISDPSNKFTVVGTTLILTDTVDIADIAYSLTLNTVDPDGNSYQQIFAIYISDPLAPAPEFTGRINIFNEEDILSLDTEVVLSYTVPSDRAVRLSTLEGFGETLGNFSVKVDGIIIARKKNTWGQYEVDFPFDEYVINPDEVLTVEVTNLKTATCPFNVRLLGYQYAV
jgi:hypothetical protein